MNDIQKKLLEIAEHYITVCEKLGLNYFAIGGTCLGAVRHGGFIPWDDDMDFGMPRKDYEIFEREAQKYLPDHLFVQTHKTDKHYLYPFMKIRDSNTTAIENELKHTKINHGVWIDIFPMDGLPDDINKRKKDEKIDRQFIRRRFLDIGYRKSLIDLFEKIISIIFFPKKKSALNKSISLTKKYDFYSSNYFWWNWGSRLEHNFTTAPFSSYIEVKFESLKFRIPIDADTYLTQHYGDWHKLPPEEKRNSGHEFYLIDLSKPYKTYLK